MRATSSTRSFNDVGVGTHNAYDALLLQGPSAWLEETVRVHYLRSTGYDYVCTKKYVEELQLGLREFFIPFLYH